MTWREAMASQLQGMGDNICAVSQAVPNSISSAAPSSISSSGHVFSLNYLLSSSLIKHLLFSLTEELLCSHYIFKTVCSSNKHMVISLHVMNLLSFHVIQVIGDHPHLPQN